MKHSLLHLPAWMALLAPLCLSAAEIEPLSIQGENFVNSRQEVVRFFGVNLTSVYPEKAQAEALAANLAGLGVNVARPHHMLRPGLDWNPHMTSGALLTYQGNSTDLDAEALDRFDYLNAALRRKGIYLMLSTHFTRDFSSGDVDILETDAEDRAAWMAAMDELNSWDWKRSFDLRKLLPMVDERCAQLNERFTRDLLTHVNPYTGQAYRDDPQVLTMEIVNESSAEYAIVCKNRYPDYWHEKLQKRWEAYAAAEGVEAGDLFQPVHPEVRARFLRKLDEDYFLRMKGFLRGLGSRAPVTFTNLWRGDNHLEMHERLADFIENHLYADPLMAAKLSDGVQEVSRSRIAGKPFIIGELNQAEGDENIRKDAPYRTMLPLAAAAYGSLQGWSGLVWYSWAHGTPKLGADGWSAAEGRSPEPGSLVSDAMMVDHFRTTALLFRRGLVAPSTQPVTMAVDQPIYAGNYHELIKARNAFRPGWQGVHAFRKTYGPVPPGQVDAPWMTQAPKRPIVSDTGEITKDTERKQLSVKSPRAEAFSGFPAAEMPAFRHLEISGAHFATVVLVPEDDKPLAQSASLIISRTGLNDRGEEIDAPGIRLAGLPQAADGRRWHFRATRPRRPDQPAAEVPLAADKTGALALPEGSWHEAELRLK